MIGKILKLILKILGAILIVGLCVWALSCTHLGKVSDFAREIRQTVTTFFAPETEAIKEKTTETARHIAQQFGWDAADVEEFITEHHIEGVEVVDLPDNAEVKKTIEKTFFDTPVTVTVYRDPGYLTISVQGQSTTVSIPDRAQKYIALLGLS